MVTLFFLATATCFMNFIASLIIKYVLKWCFKESDEDQSIRNELIDLKKEMDSISMVDEFAKYAKLQRKFIKLKDKANEKLSAKSSSKIKLKLMLEWGVWIVNGIFSSVLVFLYRKEPVVFYEKGLFWPIESILSWPTEVDNCISLPIWMMLMNLSKSAYLNLNSRTLQFP